MKKKLAVLVFALLFLSGLVMAYGQLSRERPQPPGQSFAISEHGTLLELFDGSGKSRFGKIVGDGFEVRYKTPGQTVAASAIGSKRRGLQGAQVELNGQSATASAMTEDQTLEITSYFILDDNAKELTIGRKFRNVSLKPLTLEMVRAHVDQKLAVGGQPGSSKPDDVAQLPIKGSIYGPGSDCQGPMRKCSPEPCPGRTCASLFPGKSGVILEWKQRITLAPEQQKAPAGSTLLPANEAFIVIHMSLK
ncbi:MAG: hypothetical protein AABN95_15785 [Acidobacteriota bacterium]